MKQYEKVKQAMERTGFSRNTLMKFDRPGITVRVGKIIRFDSDAPDKAIAEQSSTTDGKENANNG